MNRNKHSEINICKDTVDINVGHSIQGSYTRIFWKERIGNTNFKYLANTRAGYNSVVNYHGTKSRNEKTFKLLAQGKIHVPENYSSIRNGKQQKIQMKMLGVEYFSSGRDEADLVLRQLELGKSPKKLNREATHHSYLRG